MRYYELITESIDVRWVTPRGRSYSVKSREAIPVEIDVSKLDASWAKDGDYIAAGGVGGIRKRYPEFGEWLANASEPVEMPEVSISPWRHIAFENGRHRFSWLRDHGVKRIPVLVPAEQAEEIAERFG